MPSSEEVRVRGGSGSGALFGAVSGFAKEGARPPVPLGEIRGPAKAGHYDHGPAEAGHYDDGPAKAGHYDRRKRGSATLRERRLSLTARRIPDRIRCDVSSATASSRLRRSTQSSER